jgi:PAS domain S-box-containing protein
MVQDEFDLKQTEKNLLQSLSLLQATLDSTADGILVVDRSGRRTNYNKQYKVIFNISEEILKSGDDAAAVEFVKNQLIEPDQFVAKIQYLYNHPELESCDTLELKDGRIIERFSRPQFLDGNQIGRVWSFRDVTDRKKAEQQLYLMAQTLKSINECISLTDINDRILFINEAFLRTYGYTEQELIGQNISIVRSPHNNQEVVNKIMDITTDSGWKGEILNRRKDGSDFPISLSTKIVKNEVGDILGMVGVAVDITDRKQSEKALQDSETKYRNLIETIPDGVYRSTPEGKFVEVNPAMVKMLGYESKEELKAIDIKNQLYFDPEDRESLTLQEKLEEIGIFRLKKKDGSGIWVEDHGWYITDEADNVIFHEGILRDVTERKLDEIQLQKYSDELQELNATKDKLFSIIAHDLKSPFSSIIGLSEIIKSEARHLDIETIEQYAQAIYSTSQQTFKLLENLLDWARIQQSQMIFRPIPIVLKEVVKEVIELLFENANSKKIQIKNLVPDQKIAIADQDMLKTIFRNLISNALKFTFTNGIVEIQAISGQGLIEIAVKDSGIGINKVDLDKLFKVGSNYSRRGTENENGTGLGLMLCKEFIEKHGGRIWVESEEGKGSIFKFSLPT